MSNQEGALEGGVYNNRNWQMQQSKYKISMLVTYKDLQIGV